MNEVLIEAGPGLVGAFLESDLLDELILYQAPVIFGDKAQDILSIKEILSMDDRIDLELKDIRQVGKDFRYKYEFIK